MHAAKHPGREQPVGIRELSAAADGAGGAVDHVVDEVHAAAMREVLLVDQLEHDRGRVPPAFAVLVFFRQPLVAQERGFVEGEFEADRIGRDDGGEQRGGPGAAGHQISG